MPDVDGIELLKHIRSDEAFNSMPVVSEPIPSFRHCDYTLSFSLSIAPLLATLWS